MIRQPLEEGQMAAAASMPFIQPAPTTVEELGASMPSAPACCSLRVGWSNLVVRSYRLPSGGETVLPAVPAPCITVHLSPRATTFERLLGDCDSFSEAIFTFGSLSFVPPNRSVSLRWSQPADVLHMHISHEYVRQQAERGAGLDIDQLETIEMFGIHDELISQVGVDCLTLIQSRRIPDPLYGDVLAAMLLSRLFDYHNKQTKKDAGKRPRNINGIRMALDYIVDHFDEDVSLEKLSRVANVSLYHFIRQFRSITGTTPHRYLLNCRIEHAKMLLRGTSMSILEVGQNSGFPSHSHFTHTFCRCVGMTPTAYRERE